MLTCLQASSRTPFEQLSPVSPFDSSLLREQYSVLILLGFDESFNAITGLNGSGKSNILDAICFVLGITNMTSVRANNLLDLIYKR